MLGLFAYPGLTVPGGSADHRGDNSVRVVRVVRVVREAGLSGYCQVIVTPRRDQGAASLYPMRPH